MKPLRGPTAFGPFQQRAAEETESPTKLALRRRGSSSKCHDVSSQSVMSGTSGQEMSLATSDPHALANLFSLFLVFLIGQFCAVWWASAPQLKSWLPKPGQNDALKPPPTHQDPPTPGPTCGNNLSWPLTSCPCTDSNTSVLPVCARGWEEVGGGWRRREEEENGVPVLTDGAKSFANKFASPVSLHLAGLHQGSAALAFTTTLLFFITPCCCDV